MADHRPTDTDLSPEEEDWGTFKSSVVTVKMALTPLRRETNRGDLLCIGYLDEKRIEVLFPGRRRSAACSLERELDHFLRAQNTAAQSKGQPLPHAANLRFPLRAEGTWRTRLSETDDDEFERVYQFLAARWTYRDQFGNDHSDGGAPMPRPVTRMPAF